MRTTGMVYNGAYASEDGKRMCSCSVEEHAFMHTSSDEENSKTVQKCNRFSLEMKETKQPKWMESVAFGALIIIEMIKNADF